MSEASIFDKTIKENLISIASSYLRSFHGLFRGPKTFFRQFNDDTWILLKDAILFFATTFAIFGIAFDMWQPPSFSVDW